MSKTADAIRHALDTLENHVVGDSLLGGVKRAASIAALHEATKDVQAMHHAIKRMHACKGRYHMQQATCDLYDLLDLPNVRPTK